MIPKKYLKFTGLVLAVLLALAAACVTWIVFTVTNPASTSARAAVSAMERFYSIDHTRPITEWRAGVCSLATERGCRSVQAVEGYIDAYADQHDIQTTATVTPIRLVEFGLNRRVWLIEVAVDNAWQGAGSATGLVEVVYDGHRWLLNRLPEDKK